MLDIEYLRQNTTGAEKKVSDRGKDPKIVQEVLSLDTEYRSLLRLVEDLRSSKNKAAKEQDIETGQKIKADLDSAEERLRVAQNLFQEKLSLIPNTALPEVPTGKPDNFKILEDSGTPPKLPFTPKDHLELGENLGIIDAAAGSKVSGSRFVYLKGKGALLEIALLNFALEKLTKENRELTLGPALIKQEITNKLGYWSDGGNENYYLVHNPANDAGEEVGNLYLIGTGEHSLVPLHMDGTFLQEDLPKRYATFSPSFRREAGTYGKDTRGLIRVHQFEKLEMVTFTQPDNSEQEFDSMLAFSWNLMRELELPVRKVILTTEDISFPAAKTVDIETWFPSQEKYRETHSISTTTDFQARRLNIRFSKEGRYSFVHILNGTVFAMGRTIAAIMENNQREDGSIAIPRALQKYTEFKDIRAN